MNAKDYKHAIGTIMCCLLHSCQNLAIDADPDLSRAGQDIGQIKARLMTWVEPSQKMEPALERLAREMSQALRGALRQMQEADAKPQEDPTLKLFATLTLLPQQATEIIGFAHAAAQGATPEKSQSDTISAIIAALANAIAEAAGEGPKFTPADGNPAIPATCQVGHEMRVLRTTDAATASAANLN
jgi:hypothetical protein